jgi:UDP-glucose 6-dehydrogenase
MTYKLFRSFQYISIFGSGYVGLVTGICLSDVANHVLCVDIDAKNCPIAARQSTNPIAERVRADALVIAIEWKTFRSPDFNFIKASLAQADF